MRRVSGSGEDIKIKKTTSLKERISMIIDLQESRLHRPNACPWPGLRTDRLCTRATRTTSFASGKSLLGRLLSKSTQFHQIRHFYFSNLHTFVFFFDKAIIFSLYFSVSFILSIIL